MEVGPFEFADKIPLKSGFAQAGVRVVPGASAGWIVLGPRRGPHAELCEHQQRGSAQTRWSTPGRRSDRALRSVPACISPEESESAVSSSLLDGTGDRRGRCVHRKPLDGDRWFRVGERCGLGRRHSCSILRFAVIDAESG